MSPIKIESVRQIASLLKEDLNEYNTLIETGTLHGESILEMESYFDKLHTIELSEKYFLSFELEKNFLGKFKINNHYGDSSIVLPKLLDFLEKDDNCIFWLDGHWSSGDTAKGEKDCPLIEECRAIDSRCKSENIILLIDDYRLFDTKFEQDWSGITDEAIENCFSIFEKKEKVIFEDVLALSFKK